MPSGSKLSRYGLARAKHAACAGRTKKRALRSNQQTDEGKRCAALAHSLTKKAPYKGPGADSEEKHEPVSDVDTAAVDSLKVLDPKRPIREADKLGRVRFPLSAVVSTGRRNTYLEQKR